MTASTGSTTWPGTARPWPRRAPTPTRARHRWWWRSPRPSSTDPDGDPITYAWDFGDGGTSTGANPSHTYTANGTFTARLTVRDSGGKTGSVTVPIVVGNTRPGVTFSAPPDGGFIDFGDQVDYTVNVTDAEDGAADCTKVNVITALGHDQHAHDTGQYTGCSGTVTTTASGHDEASNVYYVLSADYTDSGGLKGSAYLTLQPKHKQAEHFTGSSGIRVIDESGAEGGRRIGDISNNDWISFSPINLSGIDTVSFRVSAPSSTGASIELRADSPTGALLASSPVPADRGMEHLRVAVPGAGHRPRWHPQCPRGVQGAVRERVRPGLRHLQRHGRRAGRRPAPGRHERAAGRGVEPVPGRQRRFPGERRPGAALGLQRPGEPAVDRHQCG
ncbi:PKD domain-containing protein [Nonomuraea ferruginea]